MIKFFRQIRKSLLSENNFSKYLLYALGEIVLVVIGILIALQINNWNNIKIEDRKETSILLQLKDGLISDKGVIESELKDLEQVQISIKHLDSLLNDSEYDYEMSLDTLFGKVYGIRNIQLNKAFYEDLKSSGIQLIKDEKIKTKVVSLYENNYGLILSLINMEYHVNEVTRPYYLKNFQHIEFGYSAHPIDYNKIWNDPQFKNIVSYRYKTIEANHISSFNKTIKDIETLVDDINTSLKSK